MERDGDWPPDLQPQSRLKQVRNSKQIILQPLDGFKDVRTHQRRVPLGAPTLCTAALPVRYAGALPLQKSRNARLAAAASKPLETTSAELVADELVALAPRPELAHRHRARVDLQDIFGRSWPPTETHAT